MPPSRPTPPWVGYPLLALALLPAAVRGEAITDAAVTPLGEIATLTHSHPAFGGLIRGKVVEPIVLAEQNNRHLEAELSDIARLESYFGTSIECNFNVLKDSYSSAVCDVLPWSGDYWPSYKDGINFVWKDGDASPAEKYATAFGLEAASFKDSISLSTGVLSESYEGSTCASDSDCDSLGDGSLCGIREGETSGYCIPTWVGICHAWAAAAMFEAEPKCDVVKNNVTFHSVDMKALISQLYDGAAIDVVFTGARFNGPDTPEELDEYGRYVDAARKDINPAFFHIAAANILGKQHQTFIVDVSSNSEVWNQPVQKYEFLETEIVDPATLSLEYFDSETYPFNSGLTYLAKCTTRLTWTAESLEDGALTTTGRIEAYTVYEDYEYTLELDENYTIIGGEWLGDSRKDHPDFLWFPAAKPTDDTVTDTGISYVELLDLIDQSLLCVDVTVSPDVVDTPSTKTPGSSYTKSPGYTKTPSTKTPVTKSPTPSTKTPAATTATPPTSTDSSEATAPATYTPETTAPPTYAPETYAPETYAPETYKPETTAPATYTPHPSLICTEDTPAPTDAPTTAPPSYPTETPVATTAGPTESPTYYPTSTPTETIAPTETPAQTPVVTMAPTYAPTYAPTSTPKSTPKTTSPASQSNQSPTQNNKKWYRRLGEFTLWW